MDADDFEDPWDSFLSSDQQVQEDEKVAHYLQRALAAAQQGRANLRQKPEEQGGPSAKIAGNVNQGRAVQMEKDLLRQRDMQVANHLPSTTGFPMGSPHFGGPGTDPYVFGVSPDNLGGLAEPLSAGQTSNYGRCKPLPNLRMLQGMRERRSWTKEEPSC